jgi:uncharacterized protein YvpB
MREGKKKHGGEGSEKMSKALQRLEKQILNTRAFKVWHTTLQISNTNRSTFQTHQKPKGMKSICRMI